MSALVDIDKEKARIQKEMERLNGDMQRYSAKLNNAGFLAKAPQSVVDEERKKLDTAADMLAKLTERLSQL